MILLIDNYDSFVHNLARYLRRLGQEAAVVRNDAIDVAGVQALQPAAIVLSPGPCTPDQAGCSLEIVRQLHTQFPILGVCLGHQTIAQALGGKIVRAPEPMHGRTSPVLHRQSPLFRGVPNPMTACRYHSLVVDATSLPADLQITAETSTGVVMAIEHRTLPVVGVQFHPEAILTQGGYRLLANFLTLAGIADDTTLPSDELAAAPVEAFVPPRVPVTF